ncbi:MAG: hypothetical protein HYZ53_24670 [Planctomycetes bacterium]|nr:hypothetical protein [Planctomycetota bacterium]
MEDVIKFYCPCGQKLGVPASVAGSKAWCTACGRRLRVPNRSLSRWLPAEELAPPKSKPALPTPVTEVLSPAQAHAILAAGDGAEPELCPRCGGEAHEEDASCPRGPAVSSPTAPAGPPAIKAADDTSAAMADESDAARAGVLAPAAEEAPAQPAEVDGGTEAVASPGERLEAGREGGEPGGEAPVDPMDAEAADAVDVTVSRAGLDSIRTPRSAEASSEAPILPSGTWEPVKPQPLPGGRGQGRTGRWHGPDTRALKNALTAAIEESSAIRPALSPNDLAAAAAAVAAPAAAGGSPGASSAARTPGPASSSAHAPSPARAAASARHLTSPGSSPLGVPGVWIAAGGAGLAAILLVVFAGSEAAPPPSPAPLIRPGPRSAPGPLRLPSASPSGESPTSRAEAAPGPGAPPAAFDPAAEGRRAAEAALLAEGRGQDTRRRLEGLRSALVRWQFEENPDPPPDVAAGGASQPESPGQPREASESEQVIVVHVRVENRGYERLPIGPTLFTYQSEGREYLSESHGAPGPVVAASVLRNGAAGSGYLLFRVPPGAPRGSLVYRPFGRTGEASISYRRD